MEVELLAVTVLGLSLRTLLQTTLLSMVEQSICTTQPITLPLIVKLAHQMKPLLMEVAFTSMNLLV